MYPFDLIRSASYNNDFSVNNEVTHDAQPVDRRGYKR